MASKRFAMELMRELPEWVNDGIISEAGAEQLRDRYPASGITQQVMLRYLQIFFSVLCAVLIGCGLILIISHNWDMFSPGWRMTVAFVPLAVAIWFGFFTLIRHENDPRYCEAAGLFLAAATAAAIAIVSQLYHLSGTLSEFLSVWLALLILPLYLFRSTGLAVVLCVGMVSLMFADYPSGRTFWWALGLGAVSFPYLFHVATSSRYTAGVMLVNRLAIVVLMTMFSLSTLVSGNGAATVYLGWPLLFSTLLQMGTLPKLRASSMRLNLFQVAGSVGVLIFIAVGSFMDFWEFSGWMRHYSGGPSLVWCGILAIAWIGLIFGGGLHTTGSIFCAILPPLSLVGLMCANEGNAGAMIAAILFNFYFACLGVVMLWDGFHRRSPWRMNGGIGVLALLIFLRFCNVGDILLYAGVFLGFGIAVAVANFMFTRHFKRLEEKQ